MNMSKQEIVFETLNICRVPEKIPRAVQHLHFSAKLTAKLIPLHCKRIIDVPVLEHPSLLCKCFSQPVRRSNSGKVVYTNFTLKCCQRRTFEEN